MGRSEKIGAAAAPEFRVPAGRDQCGGHDTSTERRRIMDAMVNTVTERGYEATEIDEVVKRAGVSRSVFARLFSSKEECFVATIKDAVRLLERAVEAGTPSEATWPERVRLGLRAFVDALVADPKRTRLAMVDAGDAGPFAAQEVQRAYQLFVPYFDEGRQHVGHDLPAPTSDAVVGGIALTVRHRVSDGDILSLADLLPDLTYFALVPYLGHRRASAVAVR